MKRTSRHLAAALLLSLYVPLVLTAQFWHVHGVTAAGSGHIALGEAGAGPNHDRTHPGICPACEIAFENETSVRQITPLPAHQGIAPSCSSAVLPQRLASGSPPRAPPCS